MLLSSLDFLDSFPLALLVPYVHSLLMLVKHIGDASGLRRRVNAAQGENLVDCTRLGRDITRIQNTFMQLREKFV
jgi:hypothetical protein